MIADDKYIILKTLDNPPRFLFWTLDVVVLLFIFFALGVTIHFSMFILALPVKIVYSKLKRKFPKSLMKHKLYWSMPHSVFVRSGKFKNIPPSYIQEVLL